MPTTLRNVFGVFEVELDSPGYSKLYLHVEPGEKREVTVSRSDGLAIRY